MNELAQSFTIGTFAKAAGVNVETIRFYQRKGLLFEPQKLYGRIRRYADADVARVRFIKSAQRLGFNLDEIAQLLELEDGPSCREVAQIAEQRLVDVRSRLEDLSRMEQVLSRLFNQCQMEHDDHSCPLIASLQTRQ